MQGEQAFATVTGVERIEVDGHLLEWERCGAGADLAVRPASAGAPCAPTGTSFRFAVADGRLRVALALFPTDRTIDVSLQPDIFRQVLPVGDGSCAPGSAGAVVTGWIVSLLDGTGAWRPDDPEGAGLLATVGGAALPLLGLAYDRGAAALREVPRWAAPALAGRTPGEGARSAFGDRSTRAVARSLAEGLVDPHPVPPSGVTPIVDDGPSTGRVGLLRLAVALMAGRVCEPDRLARLLCCPGPSHPPDRWPGGERLAAGRAVADRLGPAGAERLLSETVARADGPALLDEICRIAPGVLHLLPPRPAHRLDALRDECRGLLPTDPDPGSGGWCRLPTRTAAGTAAVARPPATRDRSAARRRTPPTAPPVDDPPAPPPDPRRRARVAPAAPAVDAGARLVPPAGAAVLQGAEVGHDARILVPRSGDELAAWGRSLQNCIGSFGPSVAAGRSLLFGVEVGGVLSYCLELAPDGTVRQFLGGRNRPVPRAIAAAVCRRMAEAGLLAADRPANQVWLEA